MEAPPASAGTRRRSLQDRCPTHQDQWSTLQQPVELTAQGEHRTPGPLLETMPRLSAALAVALACSVSAFQAPVSQPARRSVARHAEDPTKVWYADLANGVQNLLQNSPLNEGKKAVVKMMAGGYDVQATNAKLDELIANPVVMLSFTK